MARSVPSRIEVPDLIALPPTFDSPATTRCCDAWNRAYAAAKAAGKNPVSVRMRANEAYRSAMPLLSSPENIRDFIACVTFGLIIRSICDDECARLLYAAQVASSAFNSASKAAQTVTRNVSRSDPNNGVPHPPHCETVHGGVTV